MSIFIEKFITNNWGIFLLAGYMRQMIFILTKEKTLDDNPEPS